MIVNDTARRVAAGAFVAFVLIVGADFPQTEQLAVAFAYLILLSAFLTVGPVAFDRITKLFGGSTVAPTKSPGNSGGLI